MRYLIALAACASLYGQAAMYPFHIDQDGLEGAPDFSDLNHPLGPADRLFVRDGHFHRVGPDLLPRTSDDERVALFGVNLVFGANFPEERDAARLARRLRRLGVNVARLHHLDTSPDAVETDARSILTRGPYPALNRVSVARLRHLLDALAREGIYVNLNLHVGYQFRPEVDQVPGGAAVPRQSKPLHIFYPRMVELQTRFTRDVIDALGLRDDVVLGMVEINNESALVDSWQRNNLDAAVQGAYRTELQRGWNEFLARRYPGTPELRGAWASGGENGPQLLRPDGWRRELHAPASGEIAVEDGVLRVEVQRGGAPLIVKQTGFSIESGRPYLAEMEIRASAAGSVYWDIKQDVSPWRPQTGRTLQVTTAWQKVSMAFTPAFPMEGIGRFGVSVENMPGPVFIRNWSLHRVAPRGLADGETLDQANISLPSPTETGSDARMNDYLLFLTGLDRAYLDAMLAAVRDAAGSAVPVAGTQMGFGGLLNLDSHAGLDYQDNHFYVDHYGFPNAAWDNRDWFIREQSSTGSGMAAFQNMAITRQAGLPYTVSEYNQPWPNTYAAEITPMLAAFAAFQDWDSVMHFAYSHGRGWDDGVPNGFNINGDWTKFPNIGQAAWLLRSGAIRTGREPVEIGLSEEVRLRAAREKRNGGVAGLLTSMAGYDAALPFVHPVRITRSRELLVPESARKALTGPYISDTGELTYDRERRLFTIAAPAAAGIFGFAGGTKVTAGAIDVELSPSARTFIALLATSRDGKPLRESERILVSNPGYTLRTQPGSEPPRPQALVNYPNFTDRWTLEREPSFSAKPSGSRDGGVRPVWMERVECVLTLRTAARAVAVYPLDSAGRRLPPLSGAAIQSDEGSFRIHLQADGQTFSPWYEIVAEP
jgi:hypothetical protein